MKEADLLTNEVLRRSEQVFASLTDTEVTELGVRFSALAQSEPAGSVHDFAQFGCAALLAIRSSRETQTAIREGDKP